MPETTMSGGKARRRKGTKKSKGKRKAHSTRSHASSVPKALKNKARKLGIRTTSGKSRKPKSLSLLKAQIAAKKH